MLIEIDLASDEPLYLQIRTQIVHAVASGELVPGDALPSVRSLASDLGINIHTVNKAYAVLRDEGYVRMRGRSGAFIADAATQASPLVVQQREMRLAETLRRMALELRAQGGTRDDFIRLALEQADLVFNDQKEGAGR